MRPFLLVPAALLIALPTSAPAAEAPQVSWGKAGVSYYDYRKDAIECGQAAWYKDVSDTDAARTFKLATRRLEINEAALTSWPEDAMHRAVISAHIVESTRPEKRLAEVETLQYAALGKCLSDRGYVRFELTDDQQRTLRELRHGTGERHRYLHTLGSDSRVIEAQRI